MLQWTQISPAGEAVSHIIQIPSNKFSLFLTGKGDGMNRHSQILVSPIECLVPCDSNFSIADAN